MPKTKMKTRKAAAKRVKVTASGRVTHLQASRAHKLTKKSASRKRAYTIDQSTSKADEKNIKKMLGMQ